MAEPWWIPTPMCTSPPRGSDRRAARRPGVPGHDGRLCPAAGLAGRVRDRRPGRDRGDRQLRRRAARHMATAGVRVVEVDRRRQNRRRQIMAQAVQIGQGGLGGYAAGPATGSGYLLAPLAWSYSSWRRNQLSGSPGPRASFRPRGARSSHWYMPQRPSRPRA